MARQTTDRRERRLALPIPAHAVQDAAGAVALAWLGQLMTYADLSAAADDIARRLAGAGLEPGDRLATLLPNRPLTIALVHAAARIGATLVPLNVRLTTRELAWQLGDARPRLVVTDETLADRLAGEAAEGVAPTIVASASDDRALGSVSAFSELEPSVSLLRASVRPDHAQAIMYTSGTSGRPKGAILTHGALAWNATASALRLGVGASDRWLVPLPLFHVGGLAAVLRSAWYGTSVSLHEHFDAEEVASELRTGDVSLASLVPTMLSRVLDVWGDGMAPRALRAVLLGGGPVSDELLARASGHGIPIALTYGLTEAASQVATARPTSQPRLEQGLPPLPFTELLVRDESGREAPRGTIGEIAVRSPSVTAGYWNDPVATGAAVADGWLLTGDGGFLDQKGHLHVVGRRSDLIVTGGENVYPAEVEAVLDRHPAVAESCVIGLLDAEWGSRVVAVVVRRPGSAESADVDLAEHARYELAGYKTPREFIWRDSPLPRTAAGKLRRAEVRETLI